jgi:hypothetical protein
VQAASFLVGVQNFLATSFWRGVGSWGFATLTSACTAAIQLVLATLLKTIFLSWVVYPYMNVLGDLFYNMPLHVNEQHRVLGVGSLAELILHEPLRDESPASESELPAEPTNCATRLEGVAVE